MTVVKERRRDAKLRVARKMLKYYQERGMDEASPLYLAVAQAIEKGLAEKPFQPEEVLGAIDELSMELSNIYRDFRGIFHGKGGI